MNIIDAILSNLAERRRLKREGRFTELSKQELDIRKRRAELGLRMGFRNSEEVERAMAPFMARGKIEDINPELLKATGHTGYVPVRGLSGEVVGSASMQPDGTARLDIDDPTIHQMIEDGVEQTFSIRSGAGKTPMTMREKADDELNDPFQHRAAHLNLNPDILNNLLETDRPLNPFNSDSGPSQRTFMMGKVLPPGIPRPRLNINDPNVTLDESIAAPRDPRQMQLPEPTGRTDIDPDGHSPGKQLITASFIEQELDVEMVVRKHSLSGRTYQLRRKRGPRTLHTVWIRPKSYMGISRGKHRGDASGLNRRWSNYVDDNLLTKSLTSYCRKLVDNHTPEENAAMRDAIIGSRPGLLRKRIPHPIDDIMAQAVISAADSEPVDVAALKARMRARCQPIDPGAFDTTATQRESGVIIVPELGDRVYWTDPDNGLCSGEGTVTKILGMVPRPELNHLVVYTVVKDDGGIVEAFGNELTVIKENNDE